MLNTRSGFARLVWRPGPPAKQDHLVWISPELRGQDESRPQWAALTLYDLAMQLMPRRAILQLRSIKARSLHSTGGTPSQPPKSIKVSR